MLDLTRDVVFGHQDYYYGNYRGRAEEDESGTDTPPLWRASPPPSPSRRPEVINYRCLSPASKAQAIARGQRELMEMVSRMPESSYELSLRDLVEHPLVVEAKQERNVEENLKREMKKRSDEYERKVRPNRSGRYENHTGGLFLKTVFPVSLGANKRNRKKNHRDSVNSSSRISPKPPPPKGVDKEWWKKRSAESSGSDTTRSGSTKSTESSSSSSRDSNSSRHQQGGGCWSFFRGGQSKRS